MNILFREPSEEITIMLNSPLDGGELNREMLRWCYNEFGEDFIFPIGYASLLEHLNTYRHEKVRKIKRQVKANITKRLEDLDCGLNLRDSLKHLGFFSLEELANIPGLSERIMVLFKAFYDARMEEMKWDDNVADINRLDPNYSMRKGKEEILIGACYKTLYDSYLLS